MLKKLAPILFFDILVSLCFVFSNSYIWNYLNERITRNDWSPLQIAIVPQTIVEGKATTIGTFFPFPNYPFILFWIALAGNLIFIILALRSKEKTVSIAK